MESSKSEEPVKTNMEQLRIESLTLFAPLEPLSLKVSFQEEVQLSCMPQRDLTAWP